MFSAKVLLVESYEDIIIVNGFFGQGFRFENCSVDGYRPLDTIY